MLATELIDTDQSRSRITSGSLRDRSTSCFFGKSHRKSLGRVYMDPTYINVYPEHAQNGIGGMIERSDAPRPTILCNKGSRVQPDLTQSGTRSPLLPSDQQ